jgi:hypothetical protein
MGITGADVRSALGFAAVVGAGGWAVSRFAPVDNDYRKGLPPGGPIEARDWKAAAGIGAFGAVAGLGVGVMGAAIAGAPKSAIAPGMMAGSLICAALGASLVLGASMRD